MALEHFDVLIVGGGLSGIGAAHHLVNKCPGKSFAVLEGRAATGGTWDLFRYPGIRSDSDMYTMGYAFKPWTDPKAIADGPSILSYVRETAREAGIDKHIRLNHWVKRASWSSETARWTVEAELRDAHGERIDTVKLTCNFLMMCSGYYRYAAGYTPDFAGRENFKGTVVHPQRWPEDLDYAGKRVVVIGSGATAVTLVPEMAKTAANVVMLQRSPTYVVSMPAEDKLAAWFRKKFSPRTAYGLTRWKNVIMGMIFFRLSRKRPERIKRMILNGVRAALGPDYDIATHFTPRYNPWDQRLCLVPDEDLFEAIREKRAEVVTDTIERFTEGGILLSSGKELKADVIVTATGLALEVLGGVAFAVDGKTVDFSKTFNYRGMMFSDVPNLASTFGYTNASWTLKADLTCDYVCRLLNTMDRRRYAIATPRVKGDMKAVPFLDFSSGYVQRGIGKFPKQGSRAPWKLYQNYALDILSLRYGRIEDDEMEFKRAPSPVRVVTRTPEAIAAE
jgi:monooxygenase